MSRLTDSLAAFSKQEGFKSKGPLSVAIVVTHYAKKNGLPMDPDDLITDNKGQVAGLGRASVQAILKDYGIDRVLAEEGGRTSRGSIGHMRKYVEFLNALHNDGIADLDEIESWWIDRIREYFSGKPFVLRLDSSKSLGAVIRDLLGQAEKRQKEASGTMYAGAILQHLIGAKLDIILNGISHHGAFVADESSGREADFIIGDTAIHVTTTPGEALMRKCQRNIDNSLQPIILTTERGVSVAQGLAEQAGLANRIDVLDAEQFITGNVYEHGLFKSIGRRQTAGRIIEKYNEIIDNCETDPSLKIDLGK